MLALLSYPHSLPLRRCVEVVSTKQGEAEQPREREQCPTSPENGTNSHDIHEPPPECQRQQPHRVPGDIKEGENTSTHAFGDGSLHGGAEYNAYVR